MFKKFVTTVNVNGGIAVSPRALVDDRDLSRDMDEEHQRISSLARSDANARIKSVEVTTHTLVITYEYGKVKVYHWVAQ